MNGTCYRVSAPCVNINGEVSEMRYIAKMICNNCKEHVDTCDWCNKHLELGKQIVCFSNKRHFCNYECFGKEMGVRLSHVVIE